MLKRLVLLLTIASAFLPTAAAVQAQSGMLRAPNAENGGTDQSADVFTASCTGSEVLQTRAVSNFVKSLRTAGIYSKMVAVYLFAGGTEDCHKRNLLNPADSDSAFRLVFFGGATHSAAGFASNSSGYGNTQLIPQTQLTHNWSMGVWVNETVVTTAALMGASGSNAEARATLTTSAGNTVLSAFGGNTAQAAGTTNGLISVSHNNENFCTAGDKIQLYKNGVLINATSDYCTSGGRPIYPLHIGGFANGSATNNASNPAATYKFAYVSRGLDATEMLALYNAAAALQTALDR